MFAYLYIKYNKQKIMEYTAEDYDVLYGLDDVQYDVVSLDLYQLVN